MKKSYLLDDAVISPLGFTTQSNLQSIENGFTGLKSQPSSKFCPNGFYAAIIENDFLNKEFSILGDVGKYTKLEKMMILAVHKVLEKNRGLDLKKTTLIVSTTKGNIDLLSAGKKTVKGTHLYTLAETIKNFFGFELKPVVVSNACISGGLAISYAARFIKANKIDTAVIVAGDLVSDFVISGFNSFQALSPDACKPFSKYRNGISLGEAAAAVLISSKKKKNQENIQIVGDAVSNDANHISGPSRTGEGLLLSIQNALKEAKISADKIDYISAHGTGTIYNDEMEAIAFYRSGLNKVPLNSFKGAYGHTLGAASLIECILTKHSLLENKLLPSLGSNPPGVTKPLNIINKEEEREMIYALKTASGFGGCNLAIIFKKDAP